MDGMEDDDLSDSQLVRFMERYEGRTFLLFTHYIYHSAAMQ